MTVYIPFVMSLFETWSLNKYLITSVCPVKYPKFPMQSKSLYATELIMGLGTWGLEL